MVKPIRGKNSAEVILRQLKSVVCLDSVKLGEITRDQALILKREIKHISSSIAYRAAFGQLKFTLAHRMAKSFSQDRFCLNRPLTS